ncbi:MAG: hypothetical protein P9L89_09115 [Candidatus Celaenobacter polaris]|nr:hypothetical protein [Candidatus Celaenobacter polaris]
MKKEELINKLKTYCTENQSISFALIFGSYCNDNILYLKDLDIGLYTKDDIGLLNIGNPSNYGDCIRILQEKSLFS